MPCLCLHYAVRLNSGVRLQDAALTADRALAHQPGETKLALLDCPECSHTVSSAAVACPSCAYPFAAIQEGVVSADAEARTLRSEIRWGWIVSAPLAALGALAGFASGMEAGSLLSALSLAMLYAFTGYVAFGLYWGFKGVRTLIPRGVFLFLPIVGWMAYWFIKVLVIYAYGLLGGGLYEWYRRKKRLSELQRGA